MSLLDFSLSWTPIVLITILAVVLKCQALELAFWASMSTVALVVLWFKTPPDVVFLSSVDGILRNLPVLLVIYFGMLLSGLLISTGSLSRFVDWISGLTRNRWHTILLVSVGSGNFMEGAGVVAEPLVAPMLLEAELPVKGAAALAIAGYSGLMILELGGALLDVLVLVTGLDGAALSLDVALVSLPAVMLMTLFIPWLTFQGGNSWSRFLTALAVGCLAGIGALFAVRYLGPSLAGLFGGLTVLVGLSLIGARPRLPGVRVMLDMTPLLFLMASLFSINLFPPLKQAVKEAWSVEVTIVPGHAIRFQPLFSAYTYILLSYIIAVVMLRDWKTAWKNFYTTNLRAWRPMVAMALFGMAGQIIAFSGYESGFIQMDPGRNVALILANGMVTLSGKLYPVFVPFLGWVGTFLTGYGTASIVLFGKLHVVTAEMLAVSPSLMASALAVGSAVGSISSPLKIALAASMCGALGQEGEILRRTIPLGIAVSVVLGLILLIMLRFSWNS